MEQKYTFVENEKIPDKTGIKLIDGEFDGMVYIYGNVRFSEDEPPIMNFDYEIMKNPNKCKYKDSEDFEYIIGDILVEIIDEQLREDDRENNYIKSNH